MSNQLIRRYAYDPWGNRRNAADWTQADTAGNLFVTRGYTMHEHLDRFKLINMNGRMYDPVLAAFLSPDPYVQMPDNWLNYNRYSYCFGNPVRFIDPTGMYPIYAQDGTLLGTDDNGLQGHAIIMDRDNFKQGMSYEDAMKFNPRPAAFVMRHL